MEVDSVSVAKRSLEERINTWAQILAIVLGGLWAAYTFIYKEMVVPHSAPINITLKLDLRRIRQAPHDTKNSILVPLQVTASATNPSTREVHLLPSAWLAYGNKVAKQTDVPDFSNFIVSATSTMAYAQTYAKSMPRFLVAFGRLFPDSTLKPGEITTRSLIFYVAPDSCDFIGVQAVVPAVEKPGLADLEWKLNKDLAPESTMYLLDSSKSRHQLVGRERSDKEQAIGLQMSMSMSQISLWE